MISFTLTIPGSAGFHRFGRALAVSGTAGSHMEIPDNPNGSLNLYGDFTLEAWVRPLPLNAGDPVSGIIFRKAAAPEAQSGAGAPDFSYREPL